MTGSSPEWVKQTGYLKLIFVKLAGLALMNYVKIILLDDKFVVAIQKKAIQIIHILTSHGNIDQERHRCSNQVFVL